MGELQQVTNLFDMTTNCKVTELFCIIDEFCKHFDAENAGNLLEDNSGVKHRRRAASLSDSEIMTKDYAGSDEHNSKKFLGYRFKSITCRYPVK